MAIVKQTLHPEGDTGTDIYPKTSADQIENLPLSAASQLYAHYIAIFNSPSYGANDNNFMCFLINSSSIEYDSLDTFKTGFFSRMLCNGKVMYNGKAHHANYLFKSGEDISLNITDLSTGLSRSTNISSIDGYDTLTVDDVVIALGSNAG